MEHPREECGPAIEESQPPAHATPPLGNRRANVAELFTQQYPEHEASNAPPSRTDNVLHALATPSKRLSENEVANQILVCALVIRNGQVPKHFAEALALLTEDASQIAEIQVKGKQLRNTWIDACIQAQKQGNQAIGELRMRLLGAGVHEGDFRALLHEAWLCCCQNA